MAREINYEEGQKIISTILKNQGLEDMDLFRVDATVVGETNHWIARVDYAAHKGGGYQLFEGDLTDGSISVRTRVLGRGRVTPRKQMAPVFTVRPPEEIRDEINKQDLLLEFQSLLDEERAD
jgi:hypothetical protein